MNDAYNSTKTSYMETKRNLIKLTLEACRALTTFSLLEQIVELQGNFCYTEAELLRYDDAAFQSKCELLLKKLLEHRNDLIDYGITEGKLSSLNAAIAAFESISGQFAEAEKETAVCVQTTV